MYVCTVYNFLINVLIFPVVEIRVRNWSAVFLKIGHLVGYWLPSHWKCTVKLADQNGFWSAKCWNCSGNGQWPIVISSTVFPWQSKLYIIILVNSTILLQEIHNYNVCTLLYRLCMCDKLFIQLLSYVHLSEHQSNHWNSRFDFLSFSVFY